MKLIIVGCGRIGSELALSVANEGHQVTILNETDETFERLGTSFPGRMIAGNFLDQNVLLRAGIEDADGLAAVTPDDPTNFVVARAAKEIFKVPNVVVRAFDPLRMEAFEELGIRAIASSSWGAQQIKQHLTHPGIIPVLTFGHGEILLAEIQVKGNLAGKTISSLQNTLEAVPVAILRKGKGILPTSDFQLQIEDVLVVSVQANNLENLNPLIEKKKEG